MESVLILLYYELLLRFQRCNRLLQIHRRGMEQLLASVVGTGPVPYEIARSRSNLFALIERFIGHKSIGM